MCTPSLHTWYARIQTAQECHDQHTRAFPTPAAISRKADDRRRRPVTPKGGGKGGGGDEGGGIEDDGMTFSAGKV